MARTLPTYMSPCDFYAEALLQPLGYFEGSSTTADIKFMYLHYTATCTSGDSRTIYAHITLAGTGGSGEAVRGRTEVTAVAAGGVHGGHFGIEFGAAGRCSGLGAGLRGTLMVPNRALGAGTVCGGMSEIFCEGTSSDISPATHSIHRFVVDGGNATARGKVYNAFEFAGIKAGTGATDMLKTDMHTATPTDGLRVVINGAVYHFCLVSA